jgi:hypothetical protein
VEVKPLNVRDAASIEAGVTSFAQAPNGGIIVVAGALPQRHRDRIIAVTLQLTADHHLTGSINAVHLKHRVLNALH